MSSVCPEGRLQFVFDDDWKVLKWDEHPAFVDGLRKVQETRGVDFFGLYQGAPWFVEVKDFRRYRIENKRRKSSGELAEEVACKVRDTLAGLAWACNRAPLDKGELQAFLGPLVSRAAKVPVVLWLEEDRPLEPAEARTLEEAIKRHLLWLNPKVLVTSRVLSQ